MFKIRLSSLQKTILVLSITIAIFYFIFTKIDFYSVIAVLSHANHFYLLIALLFSFIILLIAAKRWQTILAMMGYSLRYKECFNLIMGALPLTSLTPSKSGDVIKAYYLKDKIPATVTAGSVLTERIFDVLTLVLFFLLGMTFCKKYESAGIAFLIFTFIIALFLLARASCKFHLPIKSSWNEKVQNVILATRLVTEDKRAFSIILSYSLLIWFVSIVQTLLFFYAVDIKVPLLFTMANIPIAIFIGLIPVTLGGMGTRDAAIIFLFSGYATPSQLLGVGILFSVFRYWLLSLMGLPFMRKMMKNVS
ncbi:MAG: lysylphosphatidylglycerol synthase transmembrane domain-containing protein [Candidatus Marinimicrobia bacterium]|nr:lysylphosphatidylglycerol synthase transmembrane domain-containing protein [Candidatus Neomarinimicrobiota bacterium]